MRFQMFQSRIVPLCHCFGVLAEAVSSRFRRPNQEHCLNEDVQAVARLRSDTRKRAIQHLLVCGLLGPLISFNRSSFAEEFSSLVVHEWGTFTALQDNQGEQLLGINVDTEPVPRFVHNLGRFLLNDAVLSSQHWIHRQKAVPRNHPQVSLRLETPVIYFYPPPEAKLPLTVDVDVRFRGGWLTEFYPRADVGFPIVQNEEFDFTDLTPQTLGQIQWHGLKIGTDVPGPDTNEHVWLAPRQVAAAGLTTAQNEHEKYLFYRGVARQLAPLRVLTENHGDSINVLANFQAILPSGHRAVVQDLWLMETREDGLSAYRRVEPLSVVNDGRTASSVIARRRFSETDFDSANRTRLETEMRDALLRDGLFADEAEALLSTWQQAYFVSPGLRLFYTVPREWTDHYLPLTISGNPRITRVMIGRIELISDAQRGLLGKLAKGPITSGDWLSKIPEHSPGLQKLLSGRSDFGELGVPIPDDFQMYLNLGRFRNALVAAEERRQGSTNLARFIQENHLEPFLLSQGSGK